jgi:hypothetical protein
MLVYFVPLTVNNRYLLFQVSSGQNSVTVLNRTHVYMNFFDHKDLGNHVMSTSRETPPTHTQFRNFCQLDENC